MRFNYSIVRNFRNFNGPELKVKWDPGINLILGPNGSGKTNLLESLSIMTGWGAFSKTANVISWNSDNFRGFVGGELSGEENFTMTANISSKISLRLNDKAISFTDLRLAIPSVIFMTGGANLIDGSPSARRLFIDRLCSLFVPPYAKRLAEFKYIMRTRIALLKQGKSIDRTTIPYCKLGGWIMDTRRKITEQLKAIMPQDKFTLNFLPALEISGEEYLQRALHENFIRERHAIRPINGPSYDELLITLCENNKLASEALSRGQKRRLILYMIIMAGKLIEQKLKRKPVLLFDDLTAELDSEGREFTYKQLVKTGWQVFITAPEKPFATRKKLGGLMLESGKPKEM